MPSTLDVHFLPLLVTSEELAGGTVVVIDVLRASTSIASALAAGAREVIPCLEVDEARRLAADRSGDSPLLGGERNGLLIDGFHLGNSPCEFTRDAVAGRTIIFTTTNGTRAMNACHRAARVLIGAFVNLSAIADQLSADRASHLLCAGTRGRITREDVLFAGALVDRKIRENAVDEIGLNDQARIARDVWQAAMDGSPTEGPAAVSRLALVLRDTQGGRNLIGIGLESDIDDAAQIDRLQVVPELEAKPWRIVSGE